ncbi:Disease resistance response protein 206 [Platanthera zijinensis]|uniref:Dirigent protein n=1 Tax=Platanthera zijinensis TaxID=2320716 RepID=A0AAP0BW49_9ASPA
MAIFKALLLLLSVTAISTAIPTPAHDSYVEKKMGSEKYTHLHLYVHIAFSGSNATAAKVVQGPTNKSLGFGDMIVVDNPITEGPDLSSKLIGREQGYTITVSRDPDLSKTINLLTINLAFIAGKHKNSTLTIMGRDPVFNVVRELSVVGGTGAFRLARGYSIWTSISFNLTGNSIIEGDIHVFHY